MEIFFNHVYLIDSFPEIGIRFLFHTLNWGTLFPPIIKLLSIFLFLSTIQVQAVEIFKQPLGVSNINLIRLDDKESFKGGSTNF